MEDLDSPVPEKPLAYKRERALRDVAATLLDSMLEDRETPSAATSHQISRARVSWETAAAVFESLVQEAPVNETRMPGEGDDAELTMGAVAIVQSKESDGLQEEVPVNPDHVRLFTLFRRLDMMFSVDTEGGVKEPDMSTALFGSILVAKASETDQPDWLAYEVGIMHLIEAVDPTTSLSPTPAQGADVETLTELALGISQLLEIGFEHRASEFFANIIGRATTEEACVAASAGLAKIYHSLRGGRVNIDDSLEYNTVSNQASEASPESSALDVSSRVDQVDSQTHHGSSKDSISRQSRSSPGAPLREKSGSNHEQARLRGTQNENDNVSGDSLGAYLKEIGLVPLLSAEEERELAQLIEKGHVAQQRIDEALALDEIPKGEDRRTVRKAHQAKDRFIRANLRLVVSVANHYSLPPSMERLDLIQDGNLGLMHAVEKFDWRKGFKFSTYAVWWIRQAIGRGLDEKGSLIRLPSHKSARLRAALKYTNEKLDDENVLLLTLRNTSSLNFEVDDDGTQSAELTPDSSPTPEQEAIANLERGVLHTLLGTLDPRVRYAVKLRYGLHDGRRRKYREVGEELGITGEGARRLIKRAEMAVRDQAGDVLDH